MFKEIKIGDVTVPMLANAATPLRYRNVFHKDIMKEMRDSESEALKATEWVPELAFIMAKAAESKEGKADMNLLNEDQFISWLEQFDAFDLPMAADAIVDLYLGNETSTVSAKKKQEDE